MFSNTEFLIAFYEISIWLRAFIVLSVIGFIIWPIFMPLIMKLLLLIVLIIKWIIKGLYIIISWLIISPLQKIIGGFFAKINNNFTSVMGDIYEKIETYYEVIKKYKKRHMGIIILIVALLTLLVALPNFFNRLSQSSSLNIFKNLYIGTEKIVFGEVDYEFIQKLKPDATPAPTVTPTSKKTASPTPVETPSSTPLIKLMVKKGSTLNMRKKADIKSRIIRTINSKTQFYYMEKIIKKNGIEWIYIKTAKGELGWCAKNYITGLP